MRVLVVGGTGFLGYHALLELWRRGHEASVLALDLPVGDLLPPGVELTLANVETCADDTLREALAGQDAVVFAMGRDDRTLHGAPALTALRRGNVDTTARVFRLASEAGAVRGVICGSYLSYLARRIPRWRLAPSHPYIQSRIEQSQAAACAAPAMRVVTLEIPWVFGAMPGRRPLWAPLVAYASSSWPLWCIRGGATMVAVRQVARAMAGAVEAADLTGQVPLAGEDLTWKDLLERLARVAGRERPARRLPDAILVPPLWAQETRTRARGLAHGLRPAAFLRVLREQACVRHVDAEVPRQVLGYGLTGLEEAFRDTVAACRGGGVSRAASSEVSTAHGAGVGCDP